MAQPEFAIFESEPDEVQSHLQLLSVVEAAVKTQHFLVQGGVLCRRGGGGGGGGGTESGVRRGGTAMRSSVSVTPSLAVTLTSLALTYPNSIDITKPSLVILDTTKSHSVICPDTIKSHTVICLDTTTSHSVIYLVTTKSHSVIPTHSQWRP